MLSMANLRLLATGSNERGDLFTRLVRDVFFALGFDDLRLNVQLTGREIDVRGRHRLEPRHMIAECKCQIGKIGGADLNKFYGVLFRERKKADNIPVAGYYVSLNGFTETALVQEKESANEGVVTLDGAQLLEEIEKSRLIVSRAQAATTAGTCAALANSSSLTFSRMELLVDDTGYVWCCYFSTAKKVTHFALVHADGTPLGYAAAQDIIAADTRARGPLSRLTFLAASSEPLAPVSQAARQHYTKWLEEECGHIHLDGLPADTDLSATRLKLEKLFVPLKALVPKPAMEDDRGAKMELVEIGDVLVRYRHVAILAAPGAGKSTLLKRLATAYSNLGRLGQTADKLPSREWLPLVLRCRDLRERARLPILQLLGDLPAHCGMTAQEGAAFSDYTHGQLRRGGVLLLIDGLDEISDEGARQIFASNLRTFLGMFPQTNLVLTSREAGFRLVAGVIASVCKQVRLAPLDAEDVTNLCVKWHIEVVADTPRVRGEAIALGQTIWESERIRSLAENPLLLTTLLVVKRTVRELPRSRTALYKEAIRVLVRTWNVEGYAPLDEEETLAQLSFVACAMMEEGKQSITQAKLLSLLRNARQELEAELQFTTVSPQAFVERIEYRSSLLMQTGHELTDGVLQAVYEFRHLTFQEYLAARGYVEEQYPGRRLERTLAELLEPRFASETWSEVIPLAAVLAGRKAEELITRLMAAARAAPIDTASIEDTESKKSPDEIAHDVLTKCLIDEVQLTAPTLRQALEQAAHDSSGAKETAWIGKVMKGKFAQVLQDVVESAYLRSAHDSEAFIFAMEAVTMSVKYADGPPDPDVSLVRLLAKELECEDELRQIRACFLAMQLFYDQSLSKKKVTQLSELVDPLDKLILSESAPTVLAACWAQAWLGDSGIRTRLPEPALIFRLYSLWRRYAHSRFPVWAFAAQPIRGRRGMATLDWGEDCDRFLLGLSDPTTSRTPWDFERFVIPSIVILGWYRGSPWNDQDLVNLIRPHVDEMMNWVKPNTQRILKLLGRQGEALLEDWKKRQPEKA